MSHADTGMHAARICADTQTWSCYKPEYNFWNDIINDFARQHQAITSTSVEV